jgi:hypothetical protein
MATQKRFIAKNGLDNNGLSITNVADPTNAQDVATKAFVLASASASGVSSVNTRTGAVTLTSADVGLGSVNNTTDVGKPVSTATQTALDLKASLASPTLSNPTYTGTLTGSTGILNIGSGQVYKDASGNVGIGTNSPSTFGGKLSVVSAASTQSTVMVQNPGQGTCHLGFASTGNNVKLYNCYATGTLAGGAGIDIDSAGSVGIGTSSPSTQLHIASATAKTRIDTTASASNNPELQLTAVARQFNIGVGGATFATTALQGSYYIYDNTAATYRMVITSAGGVSFGSSGTAYGTSGQVLTSAGNAAPTWTTPTTGTVTSVTGTAPVVSSGGTAPVISMSAASSGINGYMTGVYATKLDGIAAGATANTGTVTGVTGTAPIVSSGGTAPAISMAAASSGINGYMTSTYASKLDGIAAGATNVTNTNQLTNGAGYITSTGSISGSSASCTGNAATAGYINGTNIGRTGSNGFISDASWTSTNWANQPVSGLGMTIASTPGAPNANYGYFNKFGNRDGGGPGWGGMWMEYDGGSLWYGATTVSTSFAAWKKVLDSSNYTSYAPSLTGSGASGTWGISVTGSSASCTGNAENVTTPSAGYKHIGAWGVGRTAVGAILVNTAYTADYAASCTGNAASATTASQLTGGAPNGIFRYTPNLHLNSGQGNAVYLNWDNATTGASNTLVIGNGAGGSIFTVTAQGTVVASANITAFSDKRHKTNILKIDNALEKVKKLNGYTFDRTDMDCDRQTGVIAQEVLGVLPEAVMGSEDTTYSVAYGNMVGLLIEAIKEQQVQIDELKELINKGNK